MLRFGILFLLALLSAYNYAQTPSMNCSVLAVTKNTTTKYNIQIVGINNFKPVTMMEKSYEKSRRLKISGLTCLSISLASIVSSAVASRLTRGESDLPNYAVLGVTIPVTFAMIVVGIPQMGIGVHRTRQFRDL